MHFKTEQYFSFFKQKQTSIDAPIKRVCHANVLAQSFHHTHEVLCLVKVCVTEEKYDTRWKILYTWQKLYFRYHIAEELKYKDLLKTGGLIWDKRNMKHEKRLFVMAAPMLIITDINIDSFMSIWPNRGIF